VHQRVEGGGGKVKVRLISWDASDPPSGRPPRPSSAAPRASRPGSGPTPMSRTMTSTAPVSSRTDVIRPARRYFPYKVFFLFKCNLVLKSSPKTRPSQHWNAFVEYPQPHTQQSLQNIGVQMQQEIFTCDFMISKGRLECGCYKFFEHCGIIPHYGRTSSVFPIGFPF